jgi:hypothetical protein
VIDAGRLRRALGLTVSVRTDRRAAIVTGGRLEHRVAFTDPPGCDCVDRAIRGQECKHILACRLAVLALADAELVDALKALIAPNVSEMDAHVAPGRTNAGAVGVEGS